MEGEGGWVGGGRLRKEGGKVEEAGLGKERGVKFPSGFQLGRINSVLELTLTPSLPLFPAQHTGQATLSHSRGTEKGRDCIMATPFLRAKVAENGTIKAGADGENGEN